MLLSVHCEMVTPGQFLMLIRGVVEVQLLETLFREFYRRHATISIYDIRGTIGANVEMLSSALMTGADCDNFRCETK